MAYPTLIGALSQKPYYEYKSGLRKRHGVSGRVDEVSGHGIGTKMFWPVNERLLDAVAKGSRTFPYFAEGCVPPVEASARLRPRRDPPVGPEREIRGTSSMRGGTRDLEGKESYAVHDRGRRCADLLHRPGAGRPDLPYPRLDDEPQVLPAQHPRALPHPSCRNDGHPGTWPLRQAGA